MIGSGKTLLATLPLGILCFYIPGNVANGPTGREVTQIVGMSGNGNGNGNVGNNNGNGNVGSNNGNGNSGSNNGNGGAGSNNGNGGGGGSGVNSGPTATLSPSVATGGDSVGRLTTNATPGTVTHGIGRNHQWSHHQHKPTATIPGTSFGLLPSQ